MTAICIVFVGGYDGNSALRDFATGKLLRTFVGDSPTLANDGKFLLTDFDSRNGTYLRLKTEKALAHGDYVFIGKKLLRVELNAN